MVKRMSALAAILMVSSLTWLLPGRQVCAAEHKNIKVLAEEYRRAEGQEQRRQVAVEIGTREPGIQDLSDIRIIFLDKDYDELLFEAAMESIKRVKDPKLDGVLIDILKDEKPLLDKAEKRELQGKSEGELKHRGTNIFFIIAKLGELKSQNAVPILKEYLNYQGFQLTASQALARIGDKSAGEKIQEKAYAGADINYAGQGSQEALKIIRDLQDPSKKEKWPKIAKQIIHIHDRNAKPYLGELFNHEETYVRWEAAAKFMAMADESDAQTILEMTKNADVQVKTQAIFAMQKLQGLDFADELIALLKDPSYLVRLYAAHALGYRKVVRAVPALEEAMKYSEERDEALKGRRNEQDGELRVREEAFVALYRLTGKKYDYTGKTGVIERKAEDQKDHPSFY